MSKVQDKKNRKKATEKIQVLSFAFQVYWEKKKLMPELPDDDDHLIAERKMIRNCGMVEDFLTLYEIMSGIKTDLGIVPEPDKGTFQGMLVPYLLGFSSSAPASMDDSFYALTGLLSGQKPLQVQIFFDNEVRNAAVNWVKERYSGVSTRLGQPILKLTNMVVEFRRVVKK